MRKAGNGRGCKALFILCLGKNLSGLNEEAGEFHGGGFPTFVDEGAGEGRGAAEVAGEAELIGGVLGGDGDGGAFGFGAHRLDGEVIAEDGQASLVDDTGGGADLGISVGGDVLHEEVDEASFHLEDGEEADDFRFGAEGRGGRGGGGRGGCLSCLCGSEG